MYRTVFLTCALFTSVVTAAEKVSFNRQVRPLLSDQCFACHGPDAGKRKGELRLDIRESAIGAAKSGERAIVPGEPAKSALITRIHTEDEDDHMPPASTHKQLSAEQKALLGQWISEGAEYQEHWAYLPPVKPSVPADAGHPVDWLVQARQKSLGLQLSAEADRRTLIRRLYADLHGLPASAAAVDAFLQDAAPDAYDRLVDRLLAAPQYGERMAVWWLDIVRYADSAGYHSDKARNVSPFRDYVIDSFNRNKPFDQFTEEHLAGDLLPGASLEQKIGSCFNKLLLTTDEGGAQAKDYEARYLQDRVRAVGTVWLAQTWLCAQCHDHKFDPMLTRDFYAMGAFFADIEEGIIASPEEGMMVLKPEQQKAYDELLAGRAKIQAVYDTVTPELEQARLRWENEWRQAEQAWSPLRFSGRTTADGSTLEESGEGAYINKGAAPDKTVWTLTSTDLPAELSAFRLEALADDSLPGKGPGRAGNGNFVITEIKARLVRADGSVVKELKFAKAEATIEQAAASEKHPDKKWSAASVIDGDTRGAEFGWAVLPATGRTQSLWLDLSEPVRPGAGEQLVMEVLQNHGTKHVLGKFRLAATAAPAGSYGKGTTVDAVVATLLRKPSAARTPEEQKALMAHYRSTAPELTETRKQLADVAAGIKRMEDAAERCIVTRSMPARRTVRVLPRGDFLNESGPVVKAALPGYLYKAAATDQEPGRLELARWLTSRENPLTARVQANRLWKLFFGIGLSKTAEDFGLQGEMPPNAELLDWLAAEMMDRKWDIKAIVRLMVTSQTYRQVSVASPEMLARDPENRELTRQGRWRLDAEFVRDFALSASRLLVSDIGGGSVKPYQPEGYWENLNFPVRSWKASNGPSQYRRGLYTWWQRMFLHPAMLSFDAPSREECSVERTRSNIPQQALVLLNDPSFVEAARALASRLLTETSGDDAARLNWLWREVLQRTPGEAERAVLLPLLARHREQFQADVPAAQALARTGILPVPAIDPVELGAWTSLTRVALNLHEFITRS